MQISINPKAPDILRFLWYGNEDRMEYRHKRVVFGAKCNPYLLGMTIDLYALTAFNCLLNERYIFVHNEFQKYDD